MSRLRVLLDAEWEPLMPFMPSSDGKRGRRFRDHRVLTALVTRADAAGVIDWEVALDSTVNPAHQHATNTTRLAGGSVESQESAHRAG